MIIYPDPFTSLVYYYILLYIYIYDLWLITIDTYIILYITYIYIYWWNIIIFPELWIVKYQSLMGESLFLMVKSSYNIILMVKSPAILLYPKCIFNWGSLAALARSAGQCSASSNYCHLGSARVRSGPLGSARRSAKESGELTEVWGLTHLYALDFEKFGWIWYLVGSQSWKRCTEKPDLTPILG